jgi:tetratricopeptide (TPR) repeat protein
MRLALEYQAEGKEVLWINPEVDATFQQVRSEIQRSNADVIAMDDIDLFGHGASHLFYDLFADSEKLMIIGSIRSTRLDLLQALEGELSKIRILSYTIPHLEDSDIELLLNALTAAHRLGKLRGKTHDEQVAAFRNQAGRQLLVAMIEATSNERFEEKIDRECQELGLDAGLIYATVAIATSLRSYLTKDEILLSIGDSSNDALNRIQQLINQKLLVELAGYQIRVRHRVVADRAIDYYRNQGQLRDPIKGLLWAIATKSHRQLTKYSRERKLLTRLLNHEFMINITSDNTTPREAYALVEDILFWDYHYYLQRGSYEVETGDLDRAKNFLDQALSMAPDDYMVQTEWAYMALKRAAMNASSVGATDRANEAFQELEDAIDRRGSRDPYPYHVLGSQGLSWIRRAVMSKDEKSKLLLRLLILVRQGVRYHPRQQDLVQLEKDLNQQYLMLAVPSASKSSTNSQ